MNYDTTPWGIEMVWTNTDDYSGKISIIKEGEKTSYGYYKNRDFTIFVLQGIITLALEGKNRTLGEQETYHINPKVMHQIIAIKGDVTILEVGTKLIDGDFIEVQV